MNMVWNSSEQLTSFPFMRGAQEVLSGQSAFTEIIPTSAAAAVLPIFPSRNHNDLTRTSIFPSGENPNYDDIDPSSLPYTSPGTVFAVLVTFSVCTVFGNSLVMLAVFREHNLKSPPNYFVASLAAADFSVGILIVPFEAITQLLKRRWIFGDVWCDLWHSFDVLLTTASILNLCVISLDRYWAICTPLQYSRRMTPKRAYRFIALVWICAILISLPAIFWWRMMRTEPVPPHTCPFTEDVSYLLSSSCISFYIPLSVMLFAYYKIYLAAVKQSKSIQQGAKLFSSHDKNGTGDITLRMHRGGGGGAGNSGTNGNNNTVCGKAATTPGRLSHRKSFHFGRSDPTGLTFLNGCKRSNTMRLGKRGSSAYFTRNNGNDKGGQSNSDSVALQIKDQNGEAIVPILLMSENVGALEEVSGPISSESNVNSAIISSAPSSPIMNSPANVITTVNERTNNHHHHHNNLLFPSMSFRRQSRRSFTVARKIAKFAKEKKAAKTLAIVLGVFISCWLPFFVLNIVFALCKSCAEGHVVLFEVATWLGWINSAMNPAIYALWSPDFRRAFARLLCCARCFRAHQRRKTQRRLSAV